MAENIYERIHRVLSWQRIVAFNLILFLVLVVPISVRLAQEDTENRSGAAGGIDPVPSVEPPTAYPTEAPRIDRVSQFFGKTGDTIIILGANFGDYRWGSSVYVGNVQTPPESIIRWSNTILEVQIPESARTGKVWITVNGNQSQWEGSLLLTDVTRSAQIGFVKESSNRALLWLKNASGVGRGMVEISYVGEPTPSMIVPGTIAALTPGVDVLGKKLKIEFSLDQPLTSSQSNIIAVDHPGIGTIEIIRVELFDQNGSLISVYSDPITGKVN